MEYSEVKEQIKQKLPVQKEFGDSENLLELGLSSIVIMRLVNQWRKQGVKVAFGTLMEHPTLKEWWKIIQKGTKKKGKKAKAEKRDIIMERDMRKPFPLTDVQYAYWVGREDNQVLGGIGCHAYLEFDGYGVVPERLQEAWSRIQYHHPMLRASFSENILKGPLHSFASFCAGKIQVVKRFPKILALAIFGNGMNKKQREKLYSSLCGESTNLLFERINECKLETSIKWILPTKDRALNPKQQRVYMNNIGNIKSIIKLTAPHDVMISHPEEVAKILLEN